MAMGPPSSHVRAYNGSKASRKNRESGVGGINFVSVCQSKKQAENGNGNSKKAELQRRLFFRSCFPHRGYFRSLAHAVALCYTRIS